MSYQSYSDFSMREVVAYLSLVLVPSKWDLPIHVSSEMGQLIVDHSSMVVQIPNEVIPVT